MKILSCLTLAVLLAGCQTTRTRMQPEPEPVDAPESFAGTWSREYYDGETQTFTVEDDGDRVRGTLSEGGAAVFEAYDFQLRRDGSGRLEGEARYRLVDFPERTFTTAWKITPRGEDLLAEVEYIDHRPDGGELLRGSEEQRLRFVPAPEPEPEPEPAVAEEPGEEPQPEPAAPPAIDYSQFISPLPAYAHLLYEGMAVGHWARYESGAAGATTATRYAVVGEDDVAWLLEIDNQMNQPDLILALRLAKDGGGTLGAWAGNRGETGKERPLSGAATPPAGEPVEPTREELTVTAGSFLADRTEAAGMTTWVGVEGDAEGVMLKAEGPSYSDELTALEAGVELETAGRTWTTKRLAYQSGNELWLPVGARPWFPTAGSLQLRSPVAEGRLVGLGEDATPELTLPE